MGVFEDGELEVPVLIDSVSESSKENGSMNENDYAALKMHCLNGAQAQAESGRLFAETLRLDHLENRRVTDAQEALAHRTMAGPHIQYGSPDAPRG